MYENVNSYYRDEFGGIAIRINFFKALFWQTTIADLGCAIGIQAIEVQFICTDVIIVAATKWYNFLPVSPSSGSYVSLLLCVEVHLTVHSC